MNVALTAVFYVTCAVVVASAARSRGLTATDKERPVMKVVRLLEDMKAQLEKEKADDEAVYKQLGCWCKNNDQEKTQAIELGQNKMSDLKSALGEYAAKLEELRVALGETKTKLREDKKALDSATAIRMQEARNFHGEEKELMDSIQACKQALVVLGKHHPSFAQLQHVAKSLEALKATQLAKDALGRDKMAVLKAFLQQAKDASTYKLRRIPGFKSYTPQSGQIFGILKQMQEDFEGDLSASQKAELKAKAEFQELETAKRKELAAGQEKLMQLEQDDAMFREKNAQAYEELNDTREQVEVDETFLRNLKKKCKETDAEFQARTQSRNEELVAVQDTIAFLNSDDAFDMFDKTVNSPSFLQVRPLRGEAAAARSRAAGALRRTGSPRLAMLAESVTLDAFVKVKAAIDKMVAELSKQQQDEVEHKDWCVDEMAKNKRSTEEQNDKKASLEATIEDTKKKIVELTEEIKAKTAAVATMQKEMKKASEIREAEHAEFQAAVNDHRITQAILRKAADRMKQVYALSQVAEDPKQPGAPHIQTSGTATDPGNGPARFTEYAKSASGGKVIAMLEEVLADSKKTEDETIADEQDAQALYETFMTDSNASIKINQRAIIDMTDNKAKAEKALSMAESDLGGTMKELESLSTALADLGSSCNFLLRNFEARQESRTTEIDALREAKAILSGMK